MDPVKHEREPHCFYRKPSKQTLTSKATARSINDKTGSWIIDLNHQGNLYDCKSVVIMYWSTPMPHITCLEGKTHGKQLSMIIYMQEKFYKDCRGPESISGIGESLGNKATFVAWSWDYKQANLAANRPAMHRQHWQGLTKPVYDTIQTNFRSGTCPLSYPLSRLELRWVLALWSTERHHVAGLFSGWEFRIHCIVQPILATSFVGLSQEEKLPTMALIGYILQCWEF